PPTLPAPPLRAAPIAANQRFELGERSRVENIRGLEPGATSHRDAPPEHAELLGRMRVARDHEFDAALLGVARVNVAQIEAMEVAVDLERDAVLGRGSDEGVD